MIRSFNHIYLYISLFLFASCQHADSKSNNYELARLKSNRSEQIVEHLGYTVSFNHVWNIPNWVAYSLTKEETYGTVERDKNFYPDSDLSNSPVREDYNGVGNIGMSRGHMAPAGDMKWSKRAMRESCFMSNICPQNSKLNNGDWKALEEHARSWARKYGEIFITCGPIVSANYQTVGRNKPIAIPDSFYKVFLRKKDNAWTAIGFVFANQAGSKPLMTYIMTIDEIEDLTGIDFFYLLPDNVENKIESEYNISDWTL